MGYPPSPNGKQWAEVPIVAIGDPTKASWANDVAENEQYLNEIKSTMSVANESDISESRNTTFGGHINYFQAVLQGSGTRKKLVSVGNGTYPPSDGPGDTKGYQGRMIHIHIVARIKHDASNPAAALAYMPGGQHPQHWNSPGNSWWDHFGVLLGGAVLYTPGSALTTTIPLYSMFYSGPGGDDGVWSGHINIPFDNFGVGQDQYEWKTVQVNFYADEDTGDLYAYVDSWHEHDGNNDLVGIAGFLWCSPVIYPPE